MAQAFSSFGSSVTVIARSERLVADKPPPAGRALQAALEEDGVRFLLSRQVTAAERSGTGATLTLSSADGTVERVECDLVLVASGRLPNTDDLGLEAAGVRYDSAAGIAVDDLLRTSNPDVYAVGDCVAGVPRLTHMAGEMAKLAVQNALFDGEWRLSSLVVPRCIYTEPELASVGEVGGEISAAAAPGGVEMVEYTAALRGNDRAILEGESADGGFVTLRAEAATGRVVGGTVLAARAGEIINEISLAIKAGLSLESLGRNIHPYPTTSEAVMGCGLQWINARWRTMPRREG